MKRILERSCKEITQEDSLQFPSLFSRIVFIAQQYHLPKVLGWRLQNVRKKSNFLLKDENNLISPSQYQQAKETIEAFLLCVSGVNDQDFTGEIEDAKPATTFYDKLRVQLLRIESDKEILVCKTDSLADEEIMVRYNVEQVNTEFNNTIFHLWEGAQLNLIDVRVDKDGYYLPKMFVLEPDYLIDASAIAECFQSYASSHLHYLCRKFEPNVNSKHILLGNLANFFLDELIYADDLDSLTFRDVFLKSFRSMPFEYASCKEIADNMDFRAFMAKAESQFRNIKRVVKSDLLANGFNSMSCVLEPSFFCEKYGFQGRLDLLQLAEDVSGDSRIIELKSGKTPFPQDNVTKIAVNHEAQTVVYRLMIQSVFGANSRSVFPFILYSSADDPNTNLRFVAEYKHLQKEIINTRNLILVAEHNLYTGNVNTVETLFESLFNLGNGDVPAFFSNKLNDIKKVLDTASNLERLYFFRYINFISRELYLLKMGDESFDSSMSVSALWNTQFAERKEALELIEKLTIREIEELDRGMIVRFDREDTDECVNFREGEICVLYPRQTEDDSVLTNQILKGTIVEVSSDQVVLRFRYKQKNREFFTKYRYWAVEHDKLDHSYNAMFKSLFSFISASRDKKDLLLGLKQPRSAYNPLSKIAATREEKQKQVLEKAIAAEDYFLIVGPPGTGKTSVFAKKLIDHYYSNSDANILVMAYTNRAVDELCSAICAAFGEEEDTCDKYIRIGSELSCGEASRNRLLQSLSGEVESRRELLHILGNTRIFVGTLASIVGKPELFDLKHFQVAIIDEASQILEPQIMGLLPHFDKFIMIGDHKQLSTITLQGKDKSKVDEEDLHVIGLYDCRESLFERLFRICQERGWDNAYDTLTYHGRMHEDIARLVNEPFYDGVLKVIEDRQSNPLDYESYDTENIFQRKIASMRIGFIPVRYTDYTSLSDKINNREAETVVELTQALIDLYKRNGKDFDPQKTLGIITPYRNQIATIRHKLEEAGIPDFDKIMVDTVERYQGSQRDVIIISFCFNKPYQLHAFCNMNREQTVDRKLNVALSRAREQLFMVGNDYILRQHPIYSRMLDMIAEINRG